MPVISTNLEQGTVTLLLPRLSHIQNPNTRCNIFIFIQVP
jgi:hypothetical protein